MFFHVSLEAKIKMHPSDLGPKLNNAIKRKLQLQEEGRCMPEFGFVVAVIETKVIAKGMVSDAGNGLVSFPVKYEAVVFKPFKNEVLDTRVTAVNKMGFFAEAGPLQVFVSSHLIPEDHSFTLAEEPCYQSDDGQSRIRVNSEVRLRIIGSRVDPGKIFCIGTIKDDYTGLVRDAV